MNELVTKVQELLATDARTTVEPGGMIAFNDGKTRIIADTAGSMKVRIFDALSGERLFLGTADDGLPDNASDLISRIDEISLGDDSQALVEPINSGVEGLVTPSSPQPELKSVIEEVKAEAPSIKIEQDRLGQPRSREDVVNTLFPKHDQTGGRGEEVVSNTQ